MSSLSLNCPKGLFLMGEDGGDVNIAGGFGASKVTVNGVLPIGSGDGDNHFNSLFIENPVGDQSNAVIFSQDTTTKDLLVSTPATAAVRIASGAETEINQDIKSESTSIITDFPQQDGSTISIYSTELRLVRDVMRSLSCYKFEMSMAAARQSPQLATSICMGSTLFTQYFAGKKTETNSATGTVAVPLRMLLKTAGMLSFEFFDAGPSHPSTAPEPTPPVPRPDTLNGTSFPANGTAGDVSGGPGTPGGAGTGTPGYKGLKIVCPFIMPDMTTAPNFTQNFVTLANSLSYNNRSGGFGDSVETNVRMTFTGTGIGGAPAGYDGQFTIGCTMPPAPVPTVDFPSPSNTFSATRWAYVYVTYQPQMDLRQLD